MIFSKCCLICTYPSPGKYPFVTFARFSCSGARWLLCPASRRKSPMNAQRNNGTGTLTVYPANSSNKHWQVREDQCATVCTCFPRKNFSLIAFSRTSFSCIRIEGKHAGFCFFLLLLDISIVTDCLPLNAVEFCCPWGSAVLQRCQCLHANRMFPSPSIYIQASEILTKKRFLVVLGPPLQTAYISKLMELV